MVYNSVIDQLWRMVVEEERSNRGPTSERNFFKKVQDITSDVRRSVTWPTPLDDAQMEKQEYQIELKVWEYYFKENRGRKDMIGYEIIAFPGVAPFFDPLPNNRLTEQESAQRASEPSSESNTKVAIKTEQTSLERPEETLADREVRLSAKIAQLKKEAQDLALEAYNDSLKLNKEAVLEYHRLRRVAFEESKKHVQKVEAINSEVERLHGVLRRMGFVEQETEKAKEKMVEARKEYENLQREAKRLQMEADV
ncbi:hypothetical protein OCU04_001305 [Sclerotinia nivalis]|uniref:Uncharacterized protein n=1 Tax=Sclerotinia nivalis TaxID=352851 RepID=A0A9X0AXV2_9HELO|nr:hypothetical protein OCU04_001305 [Sclerotinia nivalis]